MAYCVTNTLTDAPCYIMSRIGTAHIYCRSGNVD